MGDIRAAARELLDISTKAELISPAFAIQLAVHGPMRFLSESEDEDLLGRLIAAICKGLLGEGVKDDVEICCHPCNPNRNGINA